ncbi:MAG TPA: hypothetical protein VF911_22000 [Thermoanaerobaculia bacterium]|jgi:ElaB/YqjD/DUF883 family membrane-anchored ribosome-binding protein
MNNNRDVLTGSDLSMPSGYEVEAATFHAPVVAEVTVVTPERSVSHKNSDMKSNVIEKLESMRKHSRMKFHDMQHLVDEKSAVMKSQLQRSMTTAKAQLQESMAVAKTTMNRSMEQANTTVHTGFNDMQSDMKVNPMKWAGIAAGSGFAIGLIGRFIHWRNKHSHTHSRMPQLVIIESAC